MSHQSVDGESNVEKVARCLFRSVTSPGYPIANAVEGARLGAKSPGVLSLLGGVGGFLEGIALGLFVQAPAHLVGVGTVKAIQDADGQIRTETYACWNPQTHGYFEPLAVDQIAEKK